MAVYCCCNDCLWISDGDARYSRRWEFKARNFDSVLLFKMGKFYEMFEMDAHTGAEVLGLVYMKVRIMTHFASAK